MIEHLLMDNNLETCIGIRAGRWDGGIYSEGSLTIWAEATISWAPPTVVKNVQLTAKIQVDADDFRKYKLEAELTRQDGAKVTLPGIDSMLPTKDDKDISYTWTQESTDWLNKIRVRITGEGKEGPKYHPDEVIKIDMFEIAITLDTELPVTQYILHNGKPFETGPVSDPSGRLWYNAGSWLQLQASDVGSGVAGTWWQIDDPTCSPAALSKCETLNVSPGGFTTGTHTIYYFSKDKAGNWEERKTEGPFNVDATLPDCLGVPITNEQGQTTYLKMTVQDTDSGVKSIEQVKCDNCTVPEFSFPTGTNDPVVVEVKKTELDKDAEVTLKLTDVAGNTNTLCTWKDVVVTSNVAQATSATISAVPQAQSKLRIQNGKPGLTNLRVKVNGKNFEVAGLKEGQINTLDVSSAMQPGNKNTITLTGQGKKGGSASVLILNGK